RGRAPHPLGRVARVDGRHRDTGRRARRRLSRGRVRVARRARGPPARCRSRARMARVLPAAVHGRLRRRAEPRPRRGRPSDRCVAVVSTKPDETRAGVALTNLDQPLFDGAGATKRDLVDYLDAMSDRIIPVLEDRPLSVVRVHRGQEAFMQKNVPKYTPDWIRTVRFWAETSKRDVSYALCNDRRTLLWFANQRAVEYHPTLVRADDPEHPTHLVLDLDPPEGDAFSLAVGAARAVRAVLTDAGMDGAVKTSGAKGVHVFVPLVARTSMEDAAHATRAIAARVERLEPEVATTAFMKEDRGHKVFVDPTRVGGAARVARVRPPVRPRMPGS